MRFLSRLRANAPRHRGTVSTARFVPLAGALFILGAFLPGLAQAVPVSVDPGQGGSSSSGPGETPKTVSASALKSDLLMIRASAPAQGASPKGLAVGGGVDKASPLLISAGSSLIPPVADWPWTIWSDAQQGAFRDDAGTLETAGTFTHASLGVGYHVSDAMTIGVAATAGQVREHEVGTASAIRSDTFAAGPYLSATLAPGLTFDVHAQWGWLEDSIHEDGGASVFKGRRNARHVTLDGRLTAEREIGNLHLTADATLFYGRDVHEAATLADSASARTLTGGTDELGRATLGLAASHAFALKDATLSPFVAGRVSWDFIQADETADDLRLSVSTGLSLTKGAFSGVASIDWDGVATHGLQSVAARLTLSQGF